MVKFCKHEDCPSSQELLEFQTGDISREGGAEIAGHLRSCEFCAAEVDFYSRYPQLNDEISSEAATIPAPLFELAEALLKNRQADPSSLDRLLKATDEVIYDNALL